jgi:hypothetical protein
MNKSQKTAGLVGAVVATAVAAGAIAMSHKETREKVFKTVKNGMKKVTTPEQRLKAQKIAIDAELAARDLIKKADKNMNDAKEKMKDAKTDVAKEARVVTA